jgi:hypothetical protein
MQVEYHFEVYENEEILSLSVDSVASQPPFLIEKVAGSKLVCYGNFLCQLRDVFKYNRDN